MDAKIHNIKDYKRKVKPQKVKPANALVCTFCLTDSFFITQNKYLQYEATCSLCSKHFSLPS